MKEIDLDYETAKRIKYLAKKYGSLIPTREGYQEMNHFLEYGEWEMAYEILILELMEEHVKIEEVDVKEMLNVAIACGLRENGGIADFYVFDKLKTWLETNHLT